MEGNSKPRVKTVRRIAGMVYILEKREGKYIIVNPGGYYDGEADYVPYFWDLYTRGEGVKDSRGIISLPVTAFHKAMFPSLRHRKVVKLKDTKEIRTTRKL